MTDKIKIRNCCLNYLRLVRQGKINAYLEKFSCDISLDIERKDRKAIVRAECRRLNLARLISVKFDFLRKTATYIFIQVKI